MISLFLCLISSHFAAAARNEYPVPIPSGGRYDVHGWLILPIDQERPQENKNTPLVGYFSHHVPELYHHSPHNFQIIVKGSLTPIESVKGENLGFQIPYPPADSLLTYEYSFTPPSPFSLNDLLSESVMTYNGVFYNGSFDTPYERYATTMATFQITDLTTAVYLNESETEGFEHLRYLSYPRGSVGTSVDFYFAHEIRAQPDFDHIVHVQILDCSMNGGAADLPSWAYTEGASWEFLDFANDLSHKLVAGQVSKATFASSQDTQDTLVCKVEVLESLHCMIGPGFMDNC